jgi:hypothetical protein
MLLIVFLAGCLLLVFGLIGLAAEKRGAKNRWPVLAKAVLTERERVLYRRLRALYPGHIILAQCALSQLIDVSPGTPNRQAIRNRFSQLVADFVLCTPDFTVVAVIELDDSTHGALERQAADARKTQAVESAGLRLVRLPGGALPSDAELRRVVDGSEAKVQVMPGMTPGSSASVVGAVRGLDLDTAAALRPVLTLIAVALVIGCGWLLYAQSAGRPLPKAVALHIAPSAPAGASVSSMGAGITKLAPGTIEAEQRRAEARVQLAAQQRVDALARQKEQAWGKYYAAPRSCEHPVAWLDQVECGNRYMRARKVFEAQWAAQREPDDYVRN